MTGDATSPTEAGQDSSRSDDQITGARDPDRLRHRAGVSADVGRDQHFLVDDRVLDRLPGYLPEDVLDPAWDRSEPEPGGDTHLLEIGAGPGALTDRLLAAGGQVTAIEQDPRLVAHLEREFASEIQAGDLQVVAGDALDIDVPTFDACVSNLPYGAASELLFRLLPERKPLVVTVQREFADRLVAEPGTADYGRLSITAGQYASIEIVEPVPPEAFHPAPAVDSAIVRSTPRDPDYVVDDADFFHRFVTALFTQRRKTVRNGIRNTAHISGLDRPDAVVEAADSSTLDRRPERLAPAEFARLANTAHDVGVSANSGSGDPP